jgi:hypothetical protein
VLTGLAWAAHWWQASAAVRKATCMMVQQGRVSGGAPARLAGMA